jgi:hypothetical protein
MSNVNHPLHYNSHGSGVECIDVVEWMGFSLGNAIKYIWRADHNCCHRGALASRGGSHSGAAAALSFVNRPGWREFQTVLGGLRRECPPALPVVVRASWLPETILGQCLRRDKRFVVMLNRDLGEPQAVEVLCHEWAHALAWNFSLDRLAKTPGINPVEFDRACHDEAWGCAYARVWRAYLEADRTDG